MLCTCAINKRAGEIHVCVCVCVKGCRARARTRCESSAAVPLLLYCKLPSLGAREIEGQVQKSDRQLRGAFLKNRILYVHTLRYAVLTKPTLTSTARI